MRIRTSSLEVVIFRLLLLPLLLLLLLPIDGAGAEVDPKSADPVQIHRSPIVQRDKDGNDVPIPPPQSPPQIPGNGTTVRLPNIFGMRVELPADDPFGYDEHGVCIVGPNEKFKVVVYGNHLDKINQLVFTMSDNCSEAIRTVDSVNDFVVHFQHKATFFLILPPLPDHVNAYKMCIRPKQAPDGYAVVPIDDVSTWLTTEKPPKEYYLPLPLQILFITFLLCLSALFSGLTLGLMSLTTMELELLIKSGTPNEQKCAAKILPIRRKGNYLLCALLLGNVVVNSAISILFGDLLSGMIALTISSLGIVIFGEIIPQSICVRKGLEVGAHTLMITQFFMVVTWPLAYPISKLLDCVLKEEVVAYDRKRLMELIKMSETENGQLADELRIAVGAMEIADKVVENCMTRIDDVFMVPESTVLNARTVAEIVRMGYTRIPVFADGDRNLVSGLMFVKDLILLDPDDNFTVKTVINYHQHPLKFVESDTPLRVTLEEFKKGECHLAMVRKKDSAKELIGIITLEDIVEEILQAEIVDEFDVVTDNVSRIRRKKRGIRNEQLARLFSEEAADAAISSQLQLVTVQWLSANEPAFHRDFVHPNVLARLIRTSTRKVDMSAMRALADEQSSPIAVLPSAARLFSKGEPSSRYVLVLEGRVEVTIGQGGMIFEAGPWHTFGAEVLKKLASQAHTLLRTTSVGNMGDPAMTAAAQAARNSAFSFKPDYSAVVRNAAVYLEITPGAYINAYKATRMQRELQANTRNTLGSGVNITGTGGESGADYASRSPSPSTGGGTGVVRRATEPLPPHSSIVMNPATAVAILTNSGLLDDDRRASLDTPASPRRDSDYLRHDALSSGDEEIHMRLLNSNYDAHADHDD